MKYKLLAIFLFAVIFVIIIYSSTYNKTIQILSIGSVLSSGKTPFNKQGYGYDYYLKKYLNDDYRLINYVKNENDILKEIEKLIKYNKEYIVKGKKITINHIISKSDYIIIDLNDIKSINNCKRNNHKQYINNQFKKIELLINKINKIFNGKIILLGYYCKEKKISNYRFSGNNTVYLDINKLLNSKYYYLPNTKSLYPSLEGYNSIANEIKKKLNK